MLTNVIDRFGFIPEPIEVRAGGYIIRPTPNHADVVATVRCASDSEYYQQVACYRGGWPLAVPSLFKLPPTHEIVKAPDEPEEQHPS